MNARDHIADVLARAYDGTPLAELRDEHAAHHRQAADRLIVAGLSDRAAVLTEAKAATVAWLVKKAREHRSTGSQQHALQADVISLLADKANRGAIRCFLDADEAGKDTGTPGESAQPADLTVYRAEYDSIVMGLYTTASEARAHCVAEERRAWASFENPTFDWIEDEEDGVAELVTVDEDGETETITGYVVTPLTVASEYDEEADE